MASGITEDGKTVIVTTNEGHRIGFAMSELNAASTAGDITTEWAAGTVPSDPEAIVRGAKVEAETYVAQHAPERPDQERAANEANKSTSDAVKDALGLP